MLVHGHAGRAGLAGRAGDVEEDQHREVAPAAEALDVEPSSGAEPANGVDAGLDRGVDVDVVALGPSARRGSGRIPRRARGRRSDRVSASIDIAELVVGGLRDAGGFVMRHGAAELVLGDFLMVTSSMTSGPVMNM